MKDAELTRLAFKAAFSGAEISDDKDMLKRWSPLTDDGDALRLAVKLKLDVLLFNGGENTVCESNNILDDIVASECWGNDPYAATRRAITRAAAEIGKGMK